MQIDDYGTPETPAMTWARRVDVWAPRLLLVAFTILALSVAQCSIASGHELYSNLTTPNGLNSCCDDRDCRQVPWRERDGVIEWNLDGHWVSAKSHNLVGPIDDAAHACWAQRSSPPNPRCLMPPGAGA